jgi:hypothetical protein
MCVSGYHCRIVSGRRTEFKSFLVRKPVSEYGVERNLDFKL